MLQDELYLLLHSVRGRDSSVDIVTGLGTGPSVVLIALGAKELSLLQTRSGSLCSPHSPLFIWYRGSFPGSERTGFEVDHSFPSSSEVENEWSYTSTPCMRLHGMHRNNTLSPSVTRRNTIGSSSMSSHFTSQNNIPE
jgi:hypothetical protein